MIDLRNAVSHNNVVPNAVADEVMRRAQNLAIILQDSVRAAEIRRLRDDLQSEIRNSQRMIESYVGCLSHPTWPLHLQAFFKDVMRDLSAKYSRKRYPKVIIQAARDWHLQYLEPDEEDWLFQETIEFAKTFTRSTSHGRRASMELQMCTRLPKTRDLKALEDSLELSDAEDEKFRIFSMPVPRSAWEEGGS